MAGAIARALICAPSSFGRTQNLAFLFPFFRPFPPTPCSPCEVSRLKSDLQVAPTYSCSPPVLFFSPPCTVFLRLSPFNKSRNGPARRGYFRAYRSFRYFARPSFVPKPALAFPAASLFSPPFTNSRRPSSPIRNAMKRSQPQIAVLATFSHEYPFVGFHLGLVQF